MNRIFSSNTSVQFLAGLLLVLPLAGSTWSMLRSDASFEGPEPSDLLAMNIHMVHMHEYDLREGKAIAEFRFMNRNSEPVTINNIKPSCGCVSIRHREERDYEAGENGRFYVEVDTAGEAAGFHEYRVEIQATTPSMTDPTSQFVTFRVDVPEKKVTVRPRALIFYQSGEKPTTQKITLTDFRDVRDLSVVEVNCARKDLKISEIHYTEDDYGHRQVEFDLTIPGSFEKGKHTDTVFVTTNDSEFQEIKIPLLIYGPKEESNLQQAEATTSASSETK